MAANKPTAVHFSLIFFVMATIVAGVMAYMYYDDGRELRASLKDAKSEAETQKTQALTRTEELDALKKKIGHAHPEIGLNAAPAEPADPNNPQQAPLTVLASIDGDLSTYSLRGPGAPAPADYKTAIRELREALQTAEANYSKEQATTRQLNQDMATLKADYDKKVREHDDARAAAVQARMDAENEHKQALQVERDQYAKLNGEHQKLKVAMQEAQNAHDQAIAEKDDRIARLTSINNILQDRIKNATRTSFEQPDGLVQWVDNDAHMVWINLGSADNLTVRTNFSVYKQGNRGVGVDSDKATLKGPEDLKGAIEVTRIVGPHRAQARILDESIYEPIAQGDPIYTPIWSPNQRHSFAFVGKIDVDDDGRSDRDLLHDVLSAANSNVQVEIDDEGNRTGGSIDERTKFLVVGEIPALEDLTDQKEKDAATKIHAEHKALKDEAREQGVRVVTLNDFMAFIGWKARQRVFRPGDRRDFTLTAGSRSTATNQTVGAASRVSSGQTSGIYSKSKRLRQPTSTGQTSGAYRGSR